MPKMPKWLAPALIAFRHVASAMHYLHVTDFHIDPLYRHNGHVVAMCHAENDGNSLDNVHANVDRAGYFGTRGSICDSPQSLVDGTFDAIARLNMTIPLVFWTGDSSRHDRDRSNPKTLNDVFQQNDLVVKQFQSTFNLSETVIVPSIGNWDVFPADYLPPKGDSPTMLDRLYESWRPLINSTEIEKSFKQGGWFKKTVEDLTIISLNTMWWFAANSAVGDCKGDGMGDEQLEWVQETLKDLKGKAILIGHVPPVFDGGILYSPQCYIKFVRLLAQDGQGDKKIIGSFFGHTNKDSMAFVIRHPVVKPDRNAQLPLKKGPSHSIDLMYLSSQHTPTYDVGDSQILSVLFTAPSVVPVNNPSFRVGKLDRVDGEWAHQYWNQIHDIVDRSKPLTFSQEYSTRDYNLTTLDRMTLHQFLLRFLVDSELSDRYERYENVEGDYVARQPIHAPLKVPRWLVILTILASVFAFVMGLVKIGADAVVNDVEPNVNERLIRGVEAMYEDDGDV